MPHRATMTDKERSTVQSDFLRSIHIAYDADAPERIAHFHPTSKSAVLLQSLLGMKEDNSFFVVAPYGSGKSLTTAFFIHAVENQKSSWPMLRTVGARMAELSPELANWLRSRQELRTGGLVLAIVGQQRNAALALRTAAEQGLRRIGKNRLANAVARMEADSGEDAIAILDKLTSDLADKEIDRVSIVWDEFGRHLEVLVRDGRASELADIQTIAEYASRSKGPQVTFGLLLHQALLQYASNMPQSIRREWTKVEGRFKAIQYVDESKELYRLLGALVRHSRTGDELSDAAAQNMAGQASELGLFRDFDKDELAELLQDAHPLHPVTLHLLPRISGRVAQHERTLFTFLNAQRLEETIFPDELYDYFSGEMRGDTAPGGTYRQWLLTQTALSKNEFGQEGEALLKTACLLGLGLAGEHTRASRKLVEFAHRQYGKRSRVKRAIDNLVGARLLLHRKHSDDLTLWHGTDADLRSHLEDAKSQLRGSFDLMEYLSQQVPAPVWRPLQYNTDYDLTRYFEGQYVDIQKLRTDAGFTSVLSDLPVDCDGRIFFVVAEQPDELEKAREFALQKFSHDRIVVAVPQAPLQLSESALEVCALQQMQQNPKLVESDPMVLPELQQMTDDARSHLQLILDRFLLPGSDGPQFVYRKKSLDVGSAPALRKCLSEITRELYPLTPKVKNEMVVRKSPSGVVINARKKLLMGVLESSGEENFGFEGYTPNVAMYRSVLLHTGLYREDEGVWRWARPEELPDEGLRRTWERIQAFFTEPSSTPKRPAKLFVDLQKPPIGIRAGLLPILFAAGLKAFPSAVALTEEGAYVDDVLPSTIERLCREPGNFRLRVLALEKKSKEFLVKMLRLFHSARAPRPTDNELVRNCYDALMVWQANLPEAALETQELSQEALSLQALLQRRFDPVQFLLHELPAHLGAADGSYTAALANIKRAKREMEGVVDRFVDEGSASIRRVLGRNGEAEAQAVAALAKEWAGCFPPQFAEGIRDGMARGTLNRMRIAYDSDAKLVDSLASLLVGRTLNRWSDHTVAQFERALAQTVQKVEEAALQVDVDELGEAAREGIERLLVSRVEDYVARLEKLVGKNRTRTLVKKMTASRSR